MPFPVCHFHELQLIDELKHCDKFIGYSPGKSPKEHEEMSLIAIMNERDARREAEVAIDKVRQESTATRRFRVQLATTVAISLVTSVLATAPIWIAKWQEVFPPPHVEVAPE